jgi:hypothetical protein
MRHFNDRSVTVLRTTPNIIQHFVTIFDIALTKTLDGTSNISQSIALNLFIHDPTPKQLFPKTMCCITTLLERLACLSMILSSKVRMYPIDVHQDDNLKIWFNEFFKYFQKSLDKAVDEAKKKCKELRTKWKALLDEESESGRMRKWRMGISKLKAEVSRVTIVLESGPRGACGVGQCNLDRVAWGQGQGIDGCSEQGSSGGTCLWCWCHIH